MLKTILGLVLAIAVVLLLFGTALLIVGILERIGRFFNRQIHVTDLKGNAKAIYLWWQNNIK